MHLNNFRKGDRQFSQFLTMFNILRSLKNAMTGNPIFSWKQCQDGAIAEP
jgi:hypothetical protein